MKKPFPAYVGPEPYVFVCYAHRDSDTVYADIGGLNDAGVNLWFDEGIRAGSSWRGDIAAAIEGASRLLFFISKKSIRSSHCLREVDYALSKDIEIIPIYLEGCSLPPELALVFSRVQALFRKADERYMEHLREAIAEGVRQTAHGQRKARSRQRMILPAVAAAVAIVAMGVLWLNQDTTEGFQRQSDAADVSGVSAFDRYLEGRELLERWDSGENLDKSIELFAEAVAEDPQFALAYARMADALRIRYALTGDKQWLERAADNAEEAARLNGDLAPVQVTLGRIHAMRGNRDLAVAAMERALAIDPNDAVANQAIAGVYVELGRTDEAEAFFKKALALAPDNPWVYDAYADFLFRQSRFDEAVEVWRSAIRIAPDLYVALVNLGSALSELGKLSEAITIYQRASETKPTYMAYSNLGTAYSRAKRYPQAVEAYQAALDIDADKWLAWGNLAFVYSWMDGMDAEAATTFKRAIALAEAARKENDRDAFVHSDLALYYAKTGQADLASQRLETALALGGESAEVTALAAEAREILGERDKAIALVRKAIELGFSKQRLGRNPELVELLGDVGVQEPPATAGSSSGL